MRTTKVYRFVGYDEMQLIWRRRCELVRIASQATRGSSFRMPNELLARQYSLELARRMSNIVRSASLGVDLFEHTFAANSGGHVGGSQQMVSVARDPDALRRSSDPAVQTICARAWYIIEFTIPSECFMEAPSDLSHSETEGVLPNYLDGLCILVTRVISNTGAVDQWMRENGLG